jgi:hypothetical protein
MLKIVILICSITLPPADCQTNTANDVISGPEAANEVMCGMHGQAYIASTAIASRQREDEYVKIKCQRTSIGKTVG